MESDIAWLDTGAPNAGSQQYVVKGPTAWFASVRVAVVRRF
jgi:hypothetical protein